MEQPDLNETNNESSNTIEQNKNFNEIKKTLWTTKGVRFESNRRLTKKNEVSLFSISILSIYTIGMSLMQISSMSNLSSVKNLSIATIIASVFIIVLSNLEASKNYCTRAERALKCGQEVSEIYIQLMNHKAAGTATPEVLSAAMRHYNRILKDFSDNHSNVDYLYFAATHPYKFNNKWYSILWHKFLYYWDIYGFPFILLCVPVVLLIYLM